MTLSISPATPAVPRFTDRTGKTIEAGQTLYLLHEEQVRTLRADFLAVSEEYPSHHVVVSDGVLWPLTACYADLVTALLDCRTKIDNYIHWHERQLRLLSERRSLVDAELKIHLTAPTVTLAADGASAAG